jgi:hypothetical protein
MNQTEIIISQALNGNLWRVCPETSRIIHSKVAHDFIPSHGSFNFSEAGKRARRNSLITHRNKKRELEVDDMVIIRMIMQSEPNMKAVARKFHARGYRASSRAVYEAIRQIRAAND